MSELNVEVWTRANRDYADADAEQNWLQDEIKWGIWHVPESELQALPDVSGKDVVELGCGTAFFGAWLKRRGARRVVGVDPTPAQLATARRCIEDASFDFAISECGASLWADPYRVPEAGRLLRPGGELVFLTSSALLNICAPDDGSVSREQLMRPQFGMYRIEWPGGVEYHLAHGEWIRLLRENGFEILDLIEIQAPADREGHPRNDFVTPEWAKKWPSEEIWRARKLG